MAIAIKLDVPWSAANVQHAVRPRAGRRGRPRGARRRQRRRGACRGQLRGRPARGAPGRQRHRLRLRGDDPAVPGRGRPLLVAADHRRGEPRGLGAAVPGAGPRRDRRRHPRRRRRRARPALRPALGRGLGRRRAGHAATPTSRYAGCCWPSTRSRPSSTRPSRGARTCWSPTTRCCCAAVHSVAATGPEGPRRDRAGPGRRRPARRAHQRRRRRPRRVRRARRRRSGCTDLRPLQPHAADPLDKLVTFVPEADARAGRRRAGRGRCRPARRLRAVRVHLGGHRHVHPAGRRRPRDRPRSGEREQVAETRIEMVLARHRRTAVVAALRAAHPYEEPAFDLVELVAPAGAARARPGRHLGARRDPAPTSPGRSRPRCRPPRPGCGSAGDPDRPVRTVAVLRGSGRRPVRRGRGPAGADAYVTADLRHHPASEALEHGGPGLVDVGHWASEWPWLADCARLLRDGLGARADTVETRVSTLVTDPWTRTAPQHEEPAAESRRLPTSCACSTCRRSTPASTSWRTGGAPCPSTPRSPSWTPSWASLRDQHRRRRDRAERPRPRADEGRGRRRPGARPGRAGPEAARRRARCPRPRSWRACSTRSRRWPSRQGDLEEVELEVMERLEAVAEPQLGELRRRAGGGRARAGRADRVPRHDHRRDRRRGRASLQAQRTHARRGRWPSDLVALYEKIREQQRRRRRRRAAPAPVRAAAGSSSTTSRSTSCATPTPTRSCAARSAAGSWCARPSRGCDPRSSSRPTAGRAATPARRRTAPSSRTPRPARCCARSPSTSASRRNNVAEYRGLIAGLEAVRELDPAATVEARLDSKLVVEQMSGRWKVKHPDMRRAGAAGPRGAAAVAR